MIRIAGHFIALLGILRLKSALIATVTSAEFVELNDFKSVSQVLLNDHFWQYLFAMSRALYAPMRVLRLADQQTPAMGLLNFIVNQTDCVLTKYLKEASEASDILLAGPMATVLSSKGAYSVDNDSNGEDKDNDDKSVNNSDIVIDVNTDSEDVHDTDDR